MKRAAALLAAGAAIALAGCGGSSDASQSAALAACVKNGARKAACQCAIAYAEAHGDSADKLTREMASHTAASDPVAVQAGVLCVGAR